MADRPLIRALDYLGYETEPLAGVAAGIVAEDPLWLRIANFHQRPLDLLRLLPPRPVLWKIEHNGREGVGPVVRRSESVTDLDAYTRALFSLGHRVVPYTFTDPGREDLSELVPALGERDLLVLPLGQKTGSAAARPRDEVRRELGIPVDAFVYGAGGFFSPEKGLDEIVAGFARTCDDPDAHLAMSLVTDEAGPEAAGRIREQWRAALPGVSLDRVHVRSGWYNEWDWMQSFLRAVDVVLVNSRCESWCRMLTEPVGLGTPVVVRRARCSTNDIVPGVALVDDFSDFSSPRFRDAVARSGRCGPELRRYVEDVYANPRVCARFLDVLRAETPPSAAAELDRLTSAPDALSGLTDAVTY